MRDELAGIGRGATIKHRWNPPHLTDSRGREAQKDGHDAPLCHETYGRYVPGGDSLLHIEEYADQVIAGTLDYETAVRLTEALTDAVGRPVAGRRDLLQVLMRKREAHHSTEEG